MNRRHFIASSLASTLGLGAIGLSVADREQSHKKTTYKKDDRAVYGHQQAEIRLNSTTLSHGDVLLFKIINKTGSKLNLGCKIPWAIEILQDGSWNTVVWTASNYYDLCATVLPPKESQSERIRLIESNLKQYTRENEGKLEPGSYRLVLTGLSPFAATNFNIIE